MLSLLAKGLISYLERVRAGEKEPFPYPDALLRGFNQLGLACVLQAVDRDKRPASIPEFVETWGRLPLVEWSLKLEISAYAFTADDRLIEPNLDAFPTSLCFELAFPAIALPPSSARAIGQ